MLQRHQFPVRLAYAMSINKAQGQTLRRVGLHLNPMVFAHGQLYVGLSRARRRADVAVRGISSPTVSLATALHALYVGVHGSRFWQVGTVATKSDQEQSIRRFGDIESSLQFIHMRTCGGVLT